MQATHILTEVNNNHAVLILNRPDCYNAFNENMIEEIIETLEYFSKNDSIQSLCIKSNGKHFSAGADLNWMIKMKEYSYEKNIEDATLLAKMLHAIAVFPKPTFSLVQGNAYGGGVGIIAATDIAIAQENSKFCFSEAKLGLIPAVIAPYILSAMGIKTTRKLFLSAETFNANDAYKWELLQNVAKDNLTIENIYQSYLKSYSKNGPEALKNIKLMINHLNPFINENTQKYTAEVIANLRISAEGQEGMQAFIEKRQASWAIN